MLSFLSLDCFLQDTVNNNPSLYYYRKKMTMRKWLSEKNNYEYTLNELSIGDPNQSETSFWLGPYVKNIQTMQ